MSDRCPLGYLFLFPTSGPQILILELETRGFNSSHFKPKVTVRQFLGFHKIKSIYVKTMLLFKVIVGMAVILNSYGHKQYAVVTI